MNIGKIFNKINSFRTFRASHIFAWGVLVSFALFYLISFISHFNVVISTLTMIFFLFIIVVIDIFALIFLIIELFIKKPLKTEILTQNPWYGVAFWISFLISFILSLIAIYFVFGVIQAHLP